MFEKFFAWKTRMIYLLTTILKVVEELSEKLKRVDYYSFLSYADQRNYREAMEYMHFLGEQYISKTIVIKEKETGLIINVGNCIGYGSIINKVIQCSGFTLIYMKETELKDTVVTTKKYVILEKDKNGEENVMIYIDDIKTIQVM